MTCQEMTFASAADGLEIHTYRWDVRRPRGVIAIAHGMAEYATRYDRFAKALMQAGFAVYALDHRGHGKSLGPKGLGHFGDAAWDGMTVDLHTLVDQARQAHPGLPVTLFGHSMGSFVSQQFCFEHSGDIDALILSGSSCFDLATVANVSDPDAEFDLSALNAPYEPGRTGFEWLSRDEAEVDLYVASPLCGFPIQSTSVARMAEQSQKLGDPELISKIRSDLPVLITSGRDDPVHGDLALLDLLEQRWREGGVTNIDVKIYEAGRHEMLNEINRDEVTRDLVAWIDKTI